MQTSQLCWGQPSFPLAAQKGFRDARGTQRYLGVCTRVEGPERFGARLGQWLDYKRAAPRFVFLKGQPRQRVWEVPAASGDPETNSRASKLTSWDAPLGGESVERASLWAGRETELTRTGKGQGAGRGPGKGQGGILRVCGAGQGWNEKEIWGDAFGEAEKCEPGAEQSDPLSKSIEGKEEPVVCLPLKCLI